MCLIVKDPQRLYKDRVRVGRRSRVFVAVLFALLQLPGLVVVTRVLQVKAEGITGVTKVVGVSKLRAKFKQ
jgi:hypothetical protein